jgi:hypothetical protein
LLALRERVGRLMALLRIMAVLVKVSGFSLEGRRLPDGAEKMSLLRAVERSGSALSLQVILRLLGLSQSRYHSWKREEECGLADMPSCRAISHDILQFSARVLATQLNYHRRRQQWRMSRIPRPLVFRCCVGQERGILATGAVPVAWLLDKSMNGMRAGIMMVE